MQGIVLVLWHICSILAAGVAHAAIIENPEPGSVHSGVFIVSGWKCEANGTITLRFNDGPDFPAVYGSDRADTTSVCDDADNGWVLLFNYNLLPEGLNFVQAFDDGEEFASVSFEVVKLNGQEFISGAKSECSTVVANNEVQLEWQEERQGFGITQAVPRQKEGCLVFGRTLASTPETHQYVTGGSAQQSLDVYALENSSEPRPALVWLHGADWLSGAKGDIDQIAFDIASQAGFHLVSVGYRLSADSSAPWPGTVYDVKAAIRWLKSNASNLGIAPNALIVSGEGAGAHLAALIATSSDVVALEGSENLGTSSDVAAAVLFAGAYDFRTIVDQADTSFSNIGCAKSFDPRPIWSLLDCITLLNVTNLDSCRLSSVYLGSPVFHVDATDPPMLIAHGALDCVMPWQQSQDLADALGQAGIVHQLSVTDTGTHEVNSLGTHVDDILTFLNANLQCSN